MADRLGGKQCGHVKNTLDPHSLCRACRAEMCDYVQNPCEVCKSKSVEEGRSIYKAVDIRADQRRRRRVSLSPRASGHSKRLRLSQSPSATSVQPLLSPLVQSGLPGLFSPLATASDSSPTWPKDTQRLESR